MSGILAGDSGGRLSFPAVFFPTLASAILDCDDKRAGFERVLLPGPLRRAGKRAKYFPRQLSLESPLNPLSLPHPLRLAAAGNSFRSGSQCRGFWLEIAGAGFCFRRVFPDVSVGDFGFLI